MPFDLFVKHVSYTIVSFCNPMAVLKLLTIELASSELDKVIILQSEDCISFDATLATRNLAFLLDINGEGLFLAFRVLDDELEDTIDL